MKKSVKALCFFTLVVCIYSCKDEYTLCNTPKNVNFTAGFYRKVSNADVATPAPSLTVFQLNGTNAIYSSQANAASLVLPLSPIVDSARYTVQLSASGPTDTITIVYKSQTVNLSYDCGNIIYNNITRFYSTTHEIDSVRITKAAVMNDALENAKIWY